MQWQALRCRSDPEAALPYRPFLSRIQKLFSSPTNVHLDSIETGFRNGTLAPPPGPMSDLELARAIREFQRAPVSDWTMQKLANRFLERRTCHQAGRGASHE